MAAFITAGIGIANSGIFARTRCSFVTSVGRRAMVARGMLRSVSVSREKKGTWVAKDVDGDTMKSGRLSGEGVVDLPTVFAKKAGIDEENNDAVYEGIGVVSSSKQLDLRVLFGEFLSTMLFVLVTMMPGDKAIVAAPLSTAAMVGATAAAYMPVSGAHLNPAVTIALAVTGRVKPFRAIAFIPIQVMAAIVGVFISRVLGASKEMPALPVSSSKSGILSAVLLEMLPMFIITCVIFLTAVATEKEGGVGPKIAPIYIALTVFACICAFQPAMFNPARAMAVGLFAGVLKGHWVYWVGSILGSVSAATLCEHMFLAPASDRAPHSWLAAVQSRYVELSGRVRTMGVAGLICYGILNLIFYCVTFAIMFAQTGVAGGTTAALAKAWILTWSLSQVTKPIRLVMSVAMAPFVNKLLTGWRKRPTQHDPY